MLSLLLNQSSGLLVSSILAGILSGVASSAVLALVNSCLAHLAHVEPNECGYFLALAAVAVGTKLVSRLLLMKLSTRTVKDLRVNLCDHMLNAPLRNLEKSGPSVLLATLTEDVSRVSEALILLPEQCANAAVGIACFSYLFWLSWPLAAAYFAVFGLGIIVYQRVAARARPAMDRARATWDMLMEYYNGLIDGSKELKLHRQRRQEFEHDGLRPTIVTMMNHSWRWNWILAIANAHTQIIFFALIGVAIFVAPSFGHFDHSVLTGFILMSLYMAGPIASIVGSLPQFQQADVALNKINSLGLSLATAGHRDIRVIGDQSEAARPFESLELRDLHYSYLSDDDEKPFSIGPFNLRINSGELVFVIGGNGSGKSSFARVVTGLYPQSSGTLLFNGEEVDDKNRDDYRQHFSVVFSDYHLFRKLYGMSSEAFLERSGGLLDMLELSAKVKVADGLLSTIDLSQGQRKRLALLTAFLEDRNVYLFDEWAADQDPLFKRVFYHEVLPGLKARGKTIVVITHDDHYFAMADRVIRFNDGEVIEDRQLVSNDVLELVV
jgi:putative ATP-binding cassette transporter